MNRELYKRLEKAVDNFIGHPYEVEEGLNITCERKAFKHGAEFGYMEAIAMAKKWLIGHTTCDVECNENGEPFAASYIESRKLAMEIADVFETDMNKIWDRADNE